MFLPTLNDSTVTNFIEDTEIFHNCINDCFVKLDIDGDGLLSRDELRRGFGRFLPIGCVLDPQDEKVSNLYDIVFERFDEDKNGSIDTKEFKTLTEEIMLAMARGIGSLPVQIALYRESLFMKAFEHELASAIPKPQSDQALEVHENKFSEGIEASPNVEQESSVQPVKADDRELGQLALGSQTDQTESKSDEQELGKESESPLKADEVAEVDSTIVQVAPEKSSQCKQRGHIFQKVKRFITKNRNVKAN